MDTSSVLFFLGAAGLLVNFPWDVQEKARKESLCRLPPRNSCPAHLNSALLAIFSFIPAHSLVAVSMRGYMKEQRGRKK